MVPIYSNCSGESLPAVDFPTLDLHWIIGVLEEGGGWFSSMQMLSGHTVVEKSLLYFVLLYYSHKSWSIVKTRDRFEIYWS